MSKELCFLLAGAAVGAGAVLLIEQGQRLRSSAPAGDLGSAGLPTGDRLSHHAGVENTHAGFEAMDEEDLETPYSGYSGT